MPIRPANIFGRRVQLFTPERNDYLFGGSGKIYLSSMDDLYGHSGSYTTSSYNDDPLGYPLKSTQQIPLDWSQFSNHTFFNSAEANVNMAFDSIINYFPFDGSRTEIQDYLDSLTGFEKYIYDRFPKNKAYLKFSASFAEVKDRKGYLVPELSEDPNAQPAIDPGTKSISFVFDVYHPGGVDLDNMTVFQKIGSTGDGISAFLSESASGASTVNLVAVATSGSNRMAATYAFDRDVFNHVAVVLNRTPGVDQVQIFSGSSLVASSNTSIEMGSMDFVTASMLVGSGVAQAVPASVISSGQFVPQQTLSGALDDFRIFHEARSNGQLAANITNTIYPIEEPNLVYLARFNEPTGSYSGNDIVLDSSGNGLHATVTGFSASLRVQNLPSGSNKPLENLNISPVLFPTFTDTVAINTDLLTSASNYDANNPSLITKLIPRHFLLEATQAEGFLDEDADTGDPYTTDLPSTPIPGSGKIGQPQIISAFLFTLAKQFDEYKIFLDHFSKLVHVDYEEEGGVADQLVTVLNELRGFDGLPFVYRLMSVAQYFSGINLALNEAVASQTAKHVTAQMLRRFLTNFQDIIRSKGTRHSIEAVFRALGINPDTSVRIREFGGSRRKDFRVTRRKIAEVRALLEMSGALNKTGASTDAQGFSSSVPYLTSTFLSSSRLEVGFPQVAGTFVNKVQFPPHGISNDPNDGLLTSGSFTVENLIRFPGRITGSYAGNQSLMRVNVTGSDGNATVANLVAVSESLSSKVTGSLQLFARPIDAKFENVIHLILTGVNVFDGSDWYVSYGRSKGTLASPFTTASYFLRAGRNRFGAGIDLYETSTIFNESAGGNTDLFSNINAAANASGSFLVVGSQSLDTAIEIGVHPPTYVTDSLARETRFEGQFGELRFFSKALNASEFEDHVWNPRSVGVVDPLKNFNFEIAPTGSFERLRLNLSVDQPVTQSTAAGKLEIVDFSQNFSSSLAAGLEASKRIIEPRRFDFAMIEPRYDERSEYNKIRLRSFENEELVQRYDASTAPLYELDRKNLPQDDTRLSIEVSLVRGLNEDIINILSTLEAIEKAMGTPDALYSMSYKELEKLRRVYFKRLTGKINFEKFFEFYNWFDVSIGHFLAQLLPAKTDFFGTNFVVESHILERAKISYQDYRQYLKVSARGDDVDEDASDARYEVDTIDGRIIG